jgi:hypothetical protein
MHTSLDELDDFILCFQDAHSSISSPIVVEEPALEPMIPPPSDGPVSSQVHLS